MADPAPSSQPFVKPWRFELRASLLCAAIFIPAGFHLPYFPLWLAQSGFDANQIAIALSAPMFLRLLTTPLITALADRIGDRANMLIAAIGASAVLSLGYLLPPTFAFVLALSIALQIVWAPHAPLVDSIVLSGVRRFGVDYPSIRKWGSAAFLCANFGGGLILARWGVAAVPVIIAAGFFVAFAVSLGTPRLGRPRVASPLSAAAMRTTPGMLTRSFVLFVAAAGIINSSHGLLYAFGSIYWREIGVDERLIGFLFAFMVVAEIALMMVFRRFFGGLSAPRLLAMAGAAGVLRWAAFPLVEPLGLGVPGFLLTQSLHALSTGFLLIGVPKMLAETVGEERMGAAQGMAFFAGGLAMSLVTMASGAIYAAFGANGFFFMAAIAAAGTALLLFVSPRAPDPAARLPSRDK